MRRVTKKDNEKGFYYVPNKCFRMTGDKYYGEDDGFSDILNKLGELEDFLEEHNVESLSDYTKQVRKEVCEEIMEKLKSKETHMSEVEIEDEYDFYYKEDVEEVLDQIQGRKDGQKN